MSITPMEMWYQMFPEERPEEQPAVSHANPEDYGLTKKQATLMRLRYLKEQLEIKRKEKIDWQQILFGCEEKSKWVVYDYLAKLEKEIDKLEKDIYYNKKTTEEKQDKNNIDIATIKQIPIQQLMETWGCKPEQKSQGRLFYKSPIRNENTASFCVYLDTNSWYDFGSSQGGSIIDLVVIHNNNCTVGEAIKYLSAFV